MKFIDFFDSYVEMGLKPIPISRYSKRPICKDWHSNWSALRWRSYFHQDKFNMGILLGDIVDVEGDSFYANNLIEKLIGNCPHPKFSSSKSIHHLFKTPDKNLTRIAYKGIEFRGQNHQSVVPPSVHGTNISYRWIQGSVFEIPEMPIDLLDYFYKIQSIKIKAKSSSTQKKKALYSTICKSCNKKIEINKKRLSLEVKAFADMNLLWACRKCRNIDIRPICRLLKGKSS